jgi:hypothetical protein
MANTAVAGPAARKAKNSKKPDNVDTSKQIEQALSRLERDVQGDREQEIEIGMFASQGEGWVPRWSDGTR